VNYINQLIDSANIPVLTAFLIGILTSISPCPLATNITAVAFISKDINNPRNTILKGFIYTLGRGTTYMILSIIMYFGISSFQVSRIFEGWGDKVLGVILISISLVMFGIIKFPSVGKSEVLEKVKLKIASKGNLGAFLLGMLFALAFCPYSGVLFFGVLTPLVLRTTEWILLPPLFALGTGLPVIIFSFLIAFSLQRVFKIFKVVSRIEKVVRYVVASTFLIVGVYYLQYVF
jgi:cytochrome c biogenesis protein CcdA